MKSKNLAILVFAGLMSFCSCDDFFELKRPQETQWTTTATYEQGLSSSDFNIQWSDAGRGFAQYIDCLLYTSPSPRD